MTQKEAYQNCIYCGYKYKQKQKTEQTLSCSNCGKSFHINPSIGVGAFCINPQKELLLIRRNTDPFLGSWDVPAGFVEISDSSVEAALKREVQEEVGASLASIQYLTSTIDLYPYQGIDRKHLSLFFVGEVSNEISINSEVKEFTFLNPRQVESEDFGFPFLKQVFESFLSYYKENYG